MPSRLLVRFDTELFGVGSEKDDNS